MGALDNLNLAEIVSTVVYSLIGVTLLGLSWIIIEWVTPFSLRREVEEDQNLAIAVLIGALFLAIAIIIAAVIRS